MGYSLSHDAFGAVFGNPDLIVACVIGDGEAETAPVATACIIPHPFYAAQSLSYKDYPVHGMRLRKTIFLLSYNGKA